MIWRLKYIIGSIFGASKFNRFGSIFYIFGGNFIELAVILILIGSKNKNVAGKLTNLLKVFLAL